MNEPNIDIAPPQLNPASSSSSSTSCSSGQLSSSLQKSELLQKENGTNHETFFAHQVKKVEKTFFGEAEKIGNCNGRQSVQNVCT